MIIRTLVLLLTFSMFGVGAFLSYQEKNTGAGLTYGAGVFGLIFVFLQSFKEFEGFGIKAKLLESKVKEVDMLLTQLQNLINPMSEMLFSVVARQGLWDSRLSKEDSYRLVNDLTSQLKSLGMSESSIENAQKEWHQYNLIALASPIIRHINQFLNKKQTKKQEEVDAFKSPVSPEEQPKQKEKIDIVKSINSECEKIGEVSRLTDKHLCYPEITKFLDNCPFISSEEANTIKQELNEDLEDLKHYTEKHDFRRLHAWFSDKQ